MPLPIEVLVVDDSAFMRQIIIKMIESDPQIKVVSYARDGVEALEKIQRFKPHVVTMDVEMPGMSGIETLRKIMCTCPTPVLMLSAVTTEGAKSTIDALELGAVDFIAKPEKRTDIGLIAKELPEKIKMAANVSVNKICKSVHLPEKINVPISVVTPKTTRNLETKNIDLVAIGTSTGGPQALHTLISMLPKGLPAALLIVQHMPKGFTATLAQRLNGLGTIPVREAKDGDIIEKGLALLAPAGYQMEVVKEQGVMRVKLLNEVTIQTLFKPSVDALFLSISKYYEKNMLGVIMTGMGNDGLRGLGVMREKGALGIGEAESSCVVYGMPRAVNEAGLTDKIVPLSKIAQEIVNYVMR
jgi:two-component system chemotaxis response regulator CheB